MAVAGTPVFVNTSGEWQRLQADEAAERGAINRAAGMQPEQRPRLATRPKGALLGNHLDASADAATPAGRLMAAQGPGPLTLGRIV